MIMTLTKTAALLLVFIIFVAMLSTGFAEDTVQAAEDKPAESSKTVYRAFELSLQQGGQNLPEGKSYKVTVQTGIDESTMIPEGSVKTRSEFRLFRILGEETEEIEGAEMKEDGTLVFTTTAFGSFSLAYTVFFGSGTEQPEEIVEEPVLLEADGVTIEVLSGDVPEDAEVVITMLDDSTVEQLLASLPIPQEA